MKNKFIEEANKLRWFNALDFGDFQTRGREADNASYFNGSLFGVFDILENIDLQGMRCLDIGSGSGLVALGLKELGAEYVAALDAFEHKAFNLGVEITGHDIDLRIASFEEAINMDGWLGSFDLVVCSGLMYHLLSPFHLVYIAKRLLKNNGLFLLQSISVRNDPNSCLHLNSQTNINGDPTTYYIPGVNAIRGMLNLSCFNVITTRTLEDLSTFTAYLSQAKINPDEVEERAYNIIKIHDKVKNNSGYNFGGYSFEKITTPTKEISTIHCNSSKKIETHIDEKKYVSTFPYNPIKLINPVGAIYR